MKRTFAFKILSVSAVSLLAAFRVQANAFTAGDLAVVQVGDGSAALTSASTAVFIDEFSTLGSQIQSLGISTGPSGLSVSGSATSEGALNLSADGQSLVVAGYNIAPGQAGVAGGSAPRGVGAINSQGVFSLATTTTSAFSANNIRSGAADGS